MAQTSDEPILVWWSGEYLIADDLGTDATGHPRCRVQYKGHRVTLVRTAGGTWLSEMFVAGMREWQKENAE